MDSVCVCVYVSNKEKVPMNLDGGRSWRERSDVNTIFIYKIIKNINEFQKLKKWFSEDRHTQLMFRDKYICRLNITCSPDSYAKFLIFFSF